MTHVDLHCPCCGECFSFAADVSEGSRQQLVIDCEICCRPIVVYLVWEGTGSFSICVERE